MRVGTALVASFLAVGAPLRAQERMPRVTPLYVVGCQTCEGPEALGLVRDVGLFPDTSLVVLDRDPPMLRVFSARGDVVGAFGRAGEGPGELRSPTALAVTSAGWIVVADIMGQALVWYDRGGAFLDTRRTASSPMELRSGPGGRWIALQEAHWKTMSGGVRLLDPSLQEIGTPVPDTDGLVVDENGEPAAAGLFSSAAGPDGRVALGHGARYDIRVLDARGAPLHRITRTLERAIRTPKEIDEILEGRRYAARLRAGDDPEAGPLHADIDPLHPHFYPRALAYDSGGRLWVRTPRGGPDATVFDLFDDGGSYLGELRLSPAIGRFALAHGLLAGITKDRATGVHQVHVWAVGGIEDQ